MTFAKPEITPEICRDLITYDQDTGILTWRERDARWFAREEQARAWNAQYAGRAALGCKGTEGYLHGAIFQKPMKAHRVAWAIVHGEWPTMVDHINGIRDDNRIVNLRSVTNSENLRNSVLPRTNKSGVMGVIWNVRDRRWIVQITANRLRRYLGCYQDFDEAVRVRRAAEIELGFHPNHGRRRA